jgi:hypothetical protein
LQGGSRFFNAAVIIEKLVLRIALGEMPLERGAGAKMQVSEPAMQDGGREREYVPLNRPHPVSKTT